MTESSVRAIFSAFWPEVLKIEFKKELAWVIASYFPRIHPVDYRLRSSERKHIILYNKQFQIIIFVNGHGAAVSVEKSMRLDLFLF